MSKTKSNLMVLNAKVKRTKTNTKKQKKINKQNNSKFKAICRKFRGLFFISTNQIFWLITNLKVQNVS